METVEIRYNKKRLFLLFGLFIIAFLGTMAYVFLSGKIKIDNKLVILTIIMVAILAYSLIPLLKRVHSNTPVIILTKQSIDINQRKSFSFLWSQIQSWNTKEDEGTKYIVLHTEEGEKSINISALDRKSKEIIELFIEYSGKPDNALLS